MVKIGVRLRKLTQN